ncbi:hypothetical protein [Mucilaginibacter flavidus]|uniref:hypothetical protein n=1 Tax=Mucilaginibacter flavidus TaxID=2949309 RepID=UPI002092AEC2|nr:hypothetical protein [Mucilaginibacter flavidus]MCO5946490.1 hypothetical protein [Mucilaginibacter flavidus]
MGYIETHGIKFHTRISNGHVEKLGSPKTDTNLNFVLQFDDPDILSQIINNLQLAINGDMDAIHDRDITADNDIASISSSGVDFYDDKGQEIIETVPLQYIYDLAVAWRNYLLQPPLNGTVAAQV